MCSLCEPANLQTGLHVSDASLLTASLLQVVGTVGAGHSEFPLAPASACVLMSDNFECAAHSNCLLPCCSWPGVHEPRPEGELGLLACASASYWLAAGHPLAGLSTFRCRGTIPTSMPS